jgi:hypothetical protein
MESRRFDSFVRSFAKGSSRRGMLRGAAIASTVALIPAAASADGGSGGPCPSVATGAGANACVCLNDRPARGVTAAPPFPALIVPGTCDKYDASKAIDLKIVGDAVNRPASQSSVISIVHSQSTLTSKLADLLSASHAVIVQASGSDTTLVSCGNVGAKATGDTLAIGLREQNGSGYSGIANFVSSDSGVTVDVFVGLDLFQTTSTETSIAFPVDSMVVAQTDINLRKTPSDSGDVVAILGEGSELKVTGAAQGKWLPVTDIASGDSGFVNSDFVIPE